MITVAIACIAKRPEREAISILWCLREDDMAHISQQIIYYNTYSTVMFWYIYSTNVDNTSVCMAKCPRWYVMNYHRLKKIIDNYNTHLRYQHASRIMSQTKFNVLGVLFHYDTYLNRFGGGMPASEVPLAIPGEHHYHRTWFKSCATQTLSDYTRAYPGKELTVSIPTWTLCDSTQTPVAISVSTWLLSGDLYQIRKHWVRS